MVSRVSAKVVPYLVMAGHNERRGKKRKRKGRCRPDQYPCPRVGPFTKVDVNCVPMVWLRKKEGKKEGGGKEEDSRVLHPTARFSVVVVPEARATRPGRGKEKESPSRRRGGGAFYLFCNSGEKKGKEEERGKEGGGGRGKI